MSKQSSKDILNELFSKFNATFDDIEQPSSDSSSSSNERDNKSKKKRKKKEKDKKELAKLKIAKDKAKKKKMKDKEKKKKLAERKSKKHKKLQDGNAEDGEIQEEGTKFKPQTIKLDIEEGEIIDEEEKAKRKSAKKKAHKEMKPSSNHSHDHSHHLDKEDRNTRESSFDTIRKKTRGSGESESHSSRSHHHHQQHQEISFSLTDHKLRHRSKEDDYHTSRRDDHTSRRDEGRESLGSGSDQRRSSTSSSSRHRHEYEESPVLRTAPPREGENRSPERTRNHYQSSYRTHWQKESRESFAPGRTYFYNDKVDRRRTDYDDYSKSDKYYGHSGIGYSGSRRYYDSGDEDNYYDYKKSSRYRSNRRSRSRSRSRSPRSSRSKTNPEDIIDKVKLLEIARHNASKLMRNGCLPSDIFSKDQIMALRAGGKSVEELTEYCKKLAEKDARGDLKDDSDSDDEHFNHPFAVKDRPLPSIVMNIKNAIPLPVRSAHELALENAKLKTVFPVSSGTRHRHKELEWHPVEEDEGKEKKKDESKSLVPVDGPKVGTVIPMPHVADADDKKNDESTTTTSPLAITDGKSSADKSSEKNSNRDVINSVPTVTVDISTLISMRLRAMRKLEENPNDEDAKEAMELATTEMKNWAEAKSLEPKFLTQAEINAGPQAWAKKDQLRNTVKLSSGMGLHLLQKMGWKPGEGLGKNKEGALEPLALDVKTDKKGLTSTGDKGGPSLPGIYDLSGKHPVSALMELTMRRRWGPPSFELCFEHGMAHKKQFVYKVTVNGVEYQPCVASQTKKLAKAAASAFCLQSLGLLKTPKPSGKNKVNNNSLTSSKPTLLQTVPNPTTTTLQTDPDPATFKVPAVPTTYNLPAVPVPAAAKPKIARTTTPFPQPPKPIRWPVSESSPPELAEPAPSPVAVTQNQGMLKPLMSISLSTPSPRPVPRLNFTQLANSSPQLPILPPKYPVLNPEFQVLRNPPNQPQITDQYLYSSSQVPTRQIPLPDYYQKLPNPVARPARMAAPIAQPQLQPQVHPSLTQSSHMQMQGQASLTQPQMQIQPPLSSYDLAPQTQVPPPNTGGFPGLITF